MRRVAWALVVVLASCGGGSGPKDASATKNAASSPAEQCMADAESRATAPVDAPERIDVAQILVRHAGVKNSADVTRTAEEACLRAQEARKKLLAGGDWDEVRAKYSDEQGAAGGVLYGVTQGDLD